MKNKFWIGRRLFVVGRIFEPTAPFGWRFTRPTYRHSLATFSIGRYGFAVVTFRGKKA